MPAAHHDESVFLWAFDLIALNGDDLRGDTLEMRNATLSAILPRSSQGLQFNDDIEDDGRLYFSTRASWALKG